MCGTLCKSQNKQLQVVERDLNSAALLLREEVVWQGKHEEKSENNMILIYDIGFLRLKQQNNNLSREERIREEEFSDLIEKKYQEMKI